MRTGLSITVCVVTLLLFICALSCVPQMQPLNGMLVSFSWFPALGVNFDFHCDGLSLLFVLLITFMGIFVFAYSHFYLQESKLYKRYVLYLFLFMLAMIATVLANNLILLFIFWEATSITSYLLISFNYRKESSQRAALQGLLVTMFGGIALLLLAFLLHNQAHTWLISDLIAKHQLLLHSRYYVLMLVLLLLAVITKSAQWPFHFWLPNAMEAPTPVSAYLHSSTMVKLGLYLVARFLPILGGTHVWQYSLSVFAIITLFVCGALLFLQFDLKRLLAYSTVMALSLVILLLADDTRLSIVAAVAFLLVHAFYKAALFLCAGNIDHCAGTRDIRQLSGLISKMPLTFIAALIAAASLAGLPPVIGFVIKELIYEAKLTGDLSWLYLTVSFLCNVTFVCLAIIFILLPFFGKGASSEIAKEKNSLAVMPFILALLSLAFGIWPNAIGQYLILPAVNSILHQKINLVFSLWHGVNASFILSVLTFVTGVIVFLLYRKFQASLLNLKIKKGMETVYQFSLENLNYCSQQVTRLVQSGQLREYVAIVFLFMSIILWASFLHFNDIKILHWFPNAPWYDYLLALVLLGSAGFLVKAAPYFVSLIMLGVVGLATMLIFLIYSAPDVAMTQLLVDILTVVIFVLALYRLPKLPKLQSMSKFLMWRNGFIAILTGSIITFLMLACVNVPFDTFISEFYTANSFLLAHGKNVVNVILVDFRAFDTLGETLVVGMAGFGVYVLWRHFYRKEK